MSRDKKLEEFIAKYGAHPETEMRLWRIWNTRKWGAINPSESFDPIFGVSESFKKYHQKAREDRNQVEVLELRAYLRSPHANRVPASNGGDRAEEAKKEFRAIYGCWPYEAPEKVLVWCEILDKHRGGKTTYKRSPKRKSMFKDIIWVSSTRQTREGWYIEERGKRPIGPFNTEHEAHSANLKRRIVNE